MCDPLIHYDRKTFNQSHSLWCNNHSDRSTSQEQVFQIDATAKCLNYRVRIWLTLRRMIKWYYRGQSQSKPFDLFNQRPLRSFHNCLGGWILILNSDVVNVNYQLISVKVFTWMLESHQNERRCLRVIVNRIYFLYGIVYWLIESGLGHTVDWVFVGIPHQ